MRSFFSLNSSNPIERVWEYIKQQLVGEVFTTLDQLRERLKQVLEKITPLAN
jgi:hypothetical protein